MSTYLTPEERLLVAIFGVRDDETVDEALSRINAMDDPANQDPESGERGGA